MKDHQAELGELAAEGGQTALLDALPAYRELQEQAPDDITDEWQQVVDAASRTSQRRSTTRASTRRRTTRSSRPTASSDDDVAAIADAADRVGSPRPRPRCRGWSSRRATCARRR